MPFSRCTHLRAARALGLLLLLPLAMAPSCNRFKGIAIAEPARGEIETDGGVRLHARVAPAIDAASVEVRLDGVDLIQHFGLVPPFSGVGGNVTIGADLVVISEFRFDPAGGGIQLSLDAAGFSPGAHDVEVSGFRPSDSVTVTDQRSVLLVGLLDEKVRATTSAGTRKSDVIAGFRLGNASAGDVSAGAPVAYPDGSELRAGVVETVEARLVGGSP